MRGARVVLFDDDGVRANMTASWLAQMNIDSGRDRRRIGCGRQERGAARRGPAPAPADSPTLTPAELAALLDDDASETLVLDVTGSANHVEGTRAGRVVDRPLAHRERPARASRSEALCDHLRIERGSQRFAASDGRWHRPADPCMSPQAARSAWIAAGCRWKPAKRPRHRVSTAIGVRMKARTTREAMNAYLEWEYGLVAQLERDGTHGFFVI